MLGLPCTRSDGPRPCSTDRGPGAGRGRVPIGGHDRRLGGCAPGSAAPRRADALGSEVVPRLPRREGIRGAVRPLALHRRGGVRRFGTWAIRVRGLSHRRDRGPTRRPSAAGSHRRGLRHRVTQKRSRAYRKSVHGRAESDGVSRGRDLHRLPRRRSTRSSRTRTRTSPRTGRRWPRPARAVTPTSSWPRSSTSPSFARSRPTWRARMRGASPPASGARCAPTATARTSSCRRRIPARRSARINIPATCGKCHKRRSSPTYRRACMARRWRAACATRRCAPTATASTASSAPASRTRRCSPPTCRARPAAAATATQRLSRKYGLPVRQRRRLRGQLSRPGPARRPAHGGELRQLPRRARHPPLQRSALACQPGQPAADLRQVPSGRRRALHARSRCTASSTTTGTTSWSPGCGSIYLWLHRPDHRLHVAHNLLDLGAQGAPDRAAGAATLPADSARAHDPRRCAGSTAW